MRKMVSLGFVVLLATQGISMQAADDVSKKGQDVKMAQIVKTGDYASQLLLKTLGGQLKAHMRQKGPIGALRFCSMHAADLRAEVDRKLGSKVSIKRITLKPRNPANEAAGDEREVLEALALLHKNGVRLPRHLVEKSPGGYKYYKPLKITKKVCLKCHGTAIDLPLKTQLDKHYPTDRARGYKMGDLRGAIVVTIKE